MATMMRTSEPKPHLANDTACYFTPKYRVMFGSRLLERPILGWKLPKTHDGYVNPKKTQERHRPRLTADDPTSRSSPDDVRSRPSTRASSSVRSPGRTCNFRVRRHAPSPSACGKRRQ